MTDTFPNPRFWELTAKVGTIAFSCKLKFFELLEVLAVSVAVCVVVTSATDALNPAVVAPAGTRMEAGSETSFELLAKATPNPFVPAAAFNKTEQEFVPDPVIVFVAQLSCLICGMAVADSLIFLEFEEVDELSMGDSSAELSLIVICPFTLPAAFGLN